MKTIKQMADESGKTKEAVRKKLQAFGLIDNYQVSGNKFVYSKEIAEQVINAFTQTKRQTSLQNELAVSLQYQLAFLVEENKRLHEALAREQTISYELSQQLKLLEAPAEQPRRWWKFWK